MLRDDLEVPLELRGHSKRHTVRNGGSGEKERRMEEERTTEGERENSA